MEHSDISGYEKPSVAVDAAVFGVESVEAATMEEMRLKLLLVKRREEPFGGSYCLPGGFLRKNETVEEALDRELLEETGTKSSRLIPLKVYSGRGRDPRGWVISAAYISLTRTVSLSTDLGSDADCAVWTDISYSREAGCERITVFHESGFKAVMERAAGQEHFSGDTDKFAFDHGQIICDAFGKLQSEVRYHDMIFDLMPETFTVSGLHGPYKMILGINETVQAFRKRMSGKIEETELYDNTKMAHRKSKLYRRRKEDINGTFSGY